MLARMLYDPPNFLVLDEPTNHLDLATKEMLIRALADFEGTLLMVSHDRHFLSALSNRVLELEPGAAPRIYGAGYADYVDRQRPRGAGHAGRVITFGSLRSSQANATRSRSEPDGPSDREGDG